MEGSREACERLLALARKLDFARRYYAIVAAASDGESCYSLSPSAIRAALESTGRPFRFNSKEQFFAMREEGAPAELGLNVAIDGSVEFILVARAPTGHIGPTFHRLALDVAKRDAPELVPSPRYPRPSYRDAAELREVLAQGLVLYSDLATAILVSGLLGEEVTGPQGLPNHSLQRRRRHRSR
jgi:hypothetical protein